MLEYIINNHKNGNKKSEGFLLNGEMHGRWIFYDESGNKFQEINYENGNSQGLSTRWGKDGNIEFIWHEINGKFEGYYLEFYDSGHIKEEGEYKNNLSCPTNFWEENGTQSLINGTGYKIAKYGYLQLDVYKQYFSNYEFVREEKIQSLIIRGFKADDESEAN